MAACFACFHIGPRTERAPGTAAAHDEAAPALLLTAATRSQTLLTSRKNTEPQRSWTFLEPQRAPWNEAAPLDGATNRAPAAITPSRPLMKQQEVTAQGGANSAANGDGGTKMLHIRGVTLATGVKA